MPFCTGDPKVNASSFIPPGQSQVGDHATDTQRSMCIWKKPRAGSPGVRGFPPHRVSQRPGPSRFPEPRATARVGARLTALSRPLCPRPCGTLHQDHLPRPPGNTGSLHRRLDPSPPRGRAWVPRGCILRQKSPGLVMRSARSQQGSVPAPGYSLEPRLRPDLQSFCVLARPTLGPALPLAPPLAMRFFRTMAPPLRRPGERSWKPLRC